MGTGGAIAAGTGGTQACQGRGGSSGGSAFAGGAGASGTACCQMPSSCVEGLCGNGVRDTCSAPSGPGSCPVYTFFEPCEGADLGGATCTSLGYGSGTLVCSSGCQLDTTGCVTCLAGTAPVTRCNQIPSTPASLSIAVTRTETGLVWLDASDGVVTGVGATFLSSGLDVIWSGRVDSLSIPVNAPSGASAQIAALPSGWLLAVTVGSTISLYTLDDTGHAVAQSALDTKSNGYGTTWPILVAQPNAGPLIIWQVIDTYAAVVSADGRSVSSPITISVDFYGGIGPILEDAEFVAGQFQAVIAVNCSLGTNCVQIFSIAPDGTLAGSFQAPGVTAPGGARLVSGASDLDLVYLSDCQGTASDSCLLWQRLSPTGTALPSPVVVDDTGTIGLPPSAVALGSDVYFAADSAGASSLVHLASDGMLAASPSRISRGDVAGTVVVRQGSNLVAAWLDAYGKVGFELALLSP
jgi:hypothetical protein